jgi:hypothetical protein
MDTKIHIELGFKIDGIYFGWHDQVLYQLPHINNGRYFGLRAIKPKTTKGGWVYYRIRRKKVGLSKLGALMQNVSWDLDKPIKLT